MQEHQLAIDEPDATHVPADSVERVEPSEEETLAQAVLRLAVALDDERGRRAAADEEARRAGADVVRLTAELAAERAQVANLERQRAALLKNLFPDGVPRGPAGDDDPAEVVEAPEDEGPDDELLESRAEMDRLRRRLRARLHRAPEMKDVEDGVDRLRESRLARDEQGRRRR